MYGRQASAQAIRYAQLQDRVPKHRRQYVGASATSISRPTQSVDVSPKTAIAAPQAATATSTARPLRLRRDSQPHVSALTAAPKPEAAYKSPTVSAPPQNNVVPSSGNSARGNPNAMAFRSM